MTVHAATGQLVEEVRSGSRPAQELLGRQHPLIEASSEGCLVTFVHESPAEGVGLYLAAAGSALEVVRPMEKIPGTGIWTATFQAPRDLHTVYGFFENPPRIELTVDGVTGDVEGLSATLVEIMATIVPDPANPLTVSLEAGPHTVPTSVVLGPDAPRRSELPMSREKGTVTEHLIDSKHLDSSRRVWLYLPPGFEPGEPHNTLVVFDGQVFHAAPDGGIEADLDRLHTHGLIGPTAALLIDSRDVIARASDLSYQPEFLGFVTDELLPWAAERIELADSPTRRAVGGASLGGSTAAFFALQAPEVFGTAICLSPAVFITYASEPAGIIDAYAMATRLPQRLHVAIGSMEEFMLPTTRAFVDVVKARGVSTTYVEYSGAHDLVGWLPQMMEGVQLAFGS